MQTLGLSESTPRTESRLKSLFWPSIKTGSDVDYLGTQGYWVCAVVGGVSFLFSLAVSPVIAALVLLYFYVGGVGVRERSRYAASVVFLMFLVDSLLSPVSVLRVLLLVLLLSNVRATWLAARWRPDSEESALPPRLGQTWGDKFADRLPMWLWPKIRYPYYFFSAVILAFTFIGLVDITLKKLR